MKYHLHQQGRECWDEHSEAQCQDWPGGADSHYDDHRQNYDDQNYDGQNYDDHRQNYDDQNYDDQNYDDQNYDD